jgi:chromosome segregation ATPase
MSENIKDTIKAEVQLVKETGQQRIERIREIVRSAVSQVGSELKSGSGDFRILVREAVTAVVENLQEKGGELKEEVTASIEGALEAVNSKRHEAIAKTQAEVKQLQAQIDQEEDKIQEEVHGILAEIKETSADKNTQVTTAIASAVETIKSSDEFELLKKRYAQLQAQLAIVQANLAARYGGRDKEVKDYLDDAQKWFVEARPRAEVTIENMKEKHSQLDSKLGEAGGAIARKEQQVKQVLKELLMTATSLFRDKEHSDNTKETVHK